MVSMAQPPEVQSLPDSCIRLDIRDGEIGLYEFLMPGLIQNTELHNMINIIATSLCMFTSITLLVRRVVILRYWWIIKL